MLAGCALNDYSLSVIQVTIVFSEKWWMISTQHNDTGAFPQDNPHTLVHGSTWCVRPSASPNIKNTCTSGSCFNKIDGFYCMISDILKWNKHHFPTASWWGIQWLLVEFTAIGLIRAKAAVLPFIVFALSVQILHSEKGRCPSIIIKVVLLSWTLWQGPRNPQKGFWGLPGVCGSCLRTIHCSVQLILLTTPKEIHSQGRV